MDRWPRPIILLHWTTGTMAMVVAALAVFLLSPPDWSQLYVDRYIAWIGWHKLGGLLVLLPAATWIVARRRTPRPPRAGGRLIQRAAHLTHLAILTLLIALPISGYLMDSLVNAQLELPAGVSLTSPFPRHEALSIAMSYAHEWGGLALLGLTAMHIIAALARACRRGDRTVGKMLPRF